MTTSLTPVAISTAKGGFTGSLRAVCAWQAEHQGALAVVYADGVDDAEICVDVAGVDFDADDIAAAVGAVCALIDAAM